jgi:hypothetical protein|uniref:Uncharacterized protein n=1 Tax=Bionectria ochroleuca TaxID=29856 RepID=A0A8H7TPF0_BIOOC
MVFLAQPNLPDQVSSSYLESVANHAALVLVDQRSAVRGGVSGLGEEHALVTLRLFLLADAAWLKRVCVSFEDRIYQVIGTGCARCSASASSRVYGLAVGGPMGQLGRKDV